MTGNTNATSKKGQVFAHRLAFRFALWLCVGAAAILLVAGLWSIQLQREHMTELIRTAANRSAETILRSTHEAMMRGESQEIRRILEAIGAQPGVERVRIFDKQGRIYVSTEQDEVGDLVPMSAEQCFV
jgi:hypothetical protein